MIASRKSNGEKREMKVEEARPVIEDMVSERLISDDAVSSHLLLLYPADPLARGVRGTTEAGNQLPLVRTAEMTCMAIGRCSHITLLPQIPERLRIVGGPGCLVLPERAL